MPFSSFLKIVITVLLLRHCFILKIHTYSILEWVSTLGSICIKMSVLLCQKAVLSKSSSWSQVTSWLIPEIASLKWKKKSSVASFVDENIRVFSPQGHKCIPDGLSNWTMIILCSPRFEISAYFRSALTRSAVLEWSLVSFLSEIHWDRFSSRHTVTPKLL